MTERDEKPIEGAPPPEESSPAPLEGEDKSMTAAAEALNETVEAGAEAAAEAEADFEPTDAPDETPATEEAAMAPEPVSGVPAVVKGPESAQDEAPHKTAITDRLISDSEYDPDASSDDRIMAAIAYASQMIIPLLVPIIILISETSKKRAFQRYHAVQAIGVSVVIWSLELGLSILASVAAASLIGILCLCFILPAMIVLWLLPLYYAILAYGGKRFSIPGLTQFLKDQRWL